MRRIAIVEDVEDNRDFLYHLLSDSYEVIRYACGKEALAGLGSDAPDIVILDLTLPDVDGFEVLRLIRLNPALQNIPVVAVTAHAMCGDREKCLAAGFTDYVAKPILDVDEFVQRINQHSARLPA